MHIWTKPQHEASNTPPSNEYSALGARDQPSLYIDIQSEEPKPTYASAVPIMKQPVVPDIPVVIECGDSEPVSTVPHPSPTFVGKVGARNGKGDALAGQTVSSLGVSQDANTGGFKTPSRVPKEFQELNFQQIQILIEKLEALKTGSPSKPPADDEEHLYDQIPEIERPTKKYGTAERSPKPQLPLRPPKPKHESTEGNKLGLKDDRKGFQKAKPQTPAVKADNKPTKPLGKCDFHSP